MLPNRLKFILDKTITVANLLEKAAAAHGDRPIFGTDEDLSLYGMDSCGASATGLAGIVNRLTNLLCEKGLRPFDRLAIWKSNSLDYFFWSFAAMRMGAIAVPVNGGMAPAQLLQYADHKGCRAIVIDPGTLDALAGLFLHEPATPLPPTLTRLLVVGDVPAAPFLPPGLEIVVVSAALLERMPDHFDAPPMNHDQDVLICHTSGTTGFPKGVLHCSRSLVLAAKGQLKVQFITSRNVAMTAAWMNHHISLSGCFTALAAGLRTHFMTRHEPGHLLAEMEARGVNVFFAFPDVYQALCRHGLDKANLDAMRMWMSGGDAMHEIHIRQLVARGAFLRLFGRRVIGSLFCELFGTSEVGMVAVMKMSSSRTRRYGRCIGWRTPVSPKVKVADAFGKPLPVGQVGRLMVKGPTVFKGYWNQHDRLHDVVRDGWWWTGDLARRDALGRFYQLDREVDCVQTAAGPVYGLLVEEEALKFPGVLEAVLIRIEDPAGAADASPLAGLVVQVAPEALPFDTEGLKAHLRKNCESADRISTFTVTQTADDIPRGLTGKVLKRVLRDAPALGLNS